MNCYRKHPSLDLLESYSLRRTPLAEHAELEEHLLVCDRCRAMLAALDKEIAALRAALRAASDYVSCAA